jgi:hypothetical protein
MLNSSSRGAGFCHREPRWETRAKFPLASTYREIFR